MRGAGSTNLHWYRIDAETGEMTNSTEDKVRILAAWHHDDPQAATNSGRVVFGKIATFIRADQLTDSERQLRARTNAAHSLLLAT